MSTMDNPAGQGTQTAVATQTERAYDEPRDASPSNLTVKKDGVKTMTTCFNITDEQIYYGDFLAVKDVTVEIPRHAITALIGPSGCGKSTFLRSLNRMHEVIPGAHVEGKVELEGVDI